MRNMNDREKLIREIEDYKPENEQEERDRELILLALKEQEDIFLRKNAAFHMTASGWVLNPAHNRILMAYHNIYHSWSWLGGHADGETNLALTAIREVQEESGISDVRQLLPGIFSLESLTVEGHEKNGKYVSSHLHLNVTYLLEADDGQPLRIREGENSGVAWFEPDKAIEASEEPWFRERIYTKLNRKLRRLGLLA